MKTRQLTKKIGGAVLGLSMILGIGFAFSTTAQAQYPNDRYEQRRQQRERLERERLERERLERERIWNQQNNGVWNNGAQNNGVQNNGDWQRNQNGQWGRRNRRGGRNGDGYGNYGGSANFRQTALNAGYNEGIKEGRNDRRRNEGYQFQDENAYQKATKDYSSRLGDRNTYSRYFREAFQNGYDAGYNGY